ncbi:uncharacterized protein CEXT_752831 [Caerostris extrusa]|uniref:Thyroglobulin type-1 domain-containing protein n=1 Tax=Caerostris extrusa TaxID=172846 RepID=A0AAV4TDI9_CAEEX|nr:uncharacterized protein CEXT_752831 [Caerostris extrusa]
MLKQLIFVVVFAVIAELSYAEREKSECEHHRERESASNAPLPLRMVPECESNGDYKQIQCFRDSKFCACWDKTGNPVTQPSGKIKSCDCMIKKHEAEKQGLLGAFKPQCEEDGKYKKVQCHGSVGSCWCAHPETGDKLSEPVRGSTPECA